MSARELVSAALDRIDATDAAIGAFVAVDGEAAYADAAAIDARVAARRRGRSARRHARSASRTWRTPSGFVTTKGSRMFADAAPAKADSLFVARLREAGCVVVGKTNTPELAWTAETTNKVFGRTANPWDTSRSPGGSSGGSAAAVASGQVPMATGSDGGGSIRIPAALCGLTGMKPSLGRVPVGGPQAPGWADLSSKGPMTRTARDAALILDSVIGPDPSDLRALPMPEQSWVDALDDLHPPRRVIWSPTLGYATVDPEVRAVCEQAVARLEDAGTEVIDRRPGVRRRSRRRVAEAGRWWPTSAPSRTNLGPDGEAWGELDDAARRDAAVGSRPHHGRRTCCGPRTSPTAQPRARRAVPPGALPPHPDRRRPDAAER